MTISAQCNFCKKELKDFGGLLFSPPTSRGETKKHHLCGKCYKEILKITRLKIAEIEDVLSLGPAWLNYTRKVKRKKR